MQLLEELWTGENTSEVHNAYQYVFDLRNRQEDTCRLAQESLHSAQSSQKHLLRKPDRKFKVGDRDLMHLPMEQNKLTLQ